MKKRYIIGGIVAAVIAIEQLLEATMSLRK